MTQEGISKLYIRIAFQYESALDQLIDKGIVDKGFADKYKETFYSTLDEEKLQASKKIKSYTEVIRSYMRGMICENMVSLTELARQYSHDSPGYVIQSWMRSRNTLEFLRQWESNMNEGFDDSACEELIHQAHTTSLTVTPSLWIRRTHAIGIRVKQGKGGGVSAYPEIATDFHLWLDPAERLMLVRFVNEIRADTEMNSKNNG